LTELNEYNESLYLKKIIPIIKSKQGILTAGDLALETSFPLIHVKYALGKLASKYIASVKATEDGGLLYDFGSKLKKVRTNGEILKIILWAPINIIKYLLKLWIMLTLILYTFLFIFLIMALLVFSIIAMIASIFTSATSSSDNNSNNNHSIWDLSFAFEALASMFKVVGNITEFLGGSSYNGRGKSPFYANVFSFVFGDDKGKKTFNYEKNIIRFHKINNKVTLSEIINLTGLSEYKARKLVIDMLIKYEGDIKVSENGVIFYVFNNISFTDIEEVEESKETNNYEFEIYSDNDFSLSYSELKEKKDKAEKRKRQLLKQNLRKELIKEVEKNYKQELKKLSRELIIDESDLAYEELKELKAQESEQNKKRYKLRKKIQAEAEAMLIDRLKLELELKDKKVVKAKETYSYVWTRKASFTKLNYNTATENAYIICFNVFNLIMSFILGNLLLHGTELNSLSLNRENIFTLFNNDSTLVFLLFTYPFLFSIVLFIIPAFRFVLLIFELPKIKRINDFLELLELIFKSKRKYLEFLSVKRSLRNRLFTNYPTLFEHDFIEEKEIINLKNYKAEIIKVDSLTN